MMPQSDQLLESVYDVIDRQDGERNRADVARIALLAAQFRANQLKQARMQQAIERRKASIRDGGEHRSDNPAGRLSPVRPGGEREAE